MNTRTAVRFALCMTGNYDVPDRTLTVSGVDERGNAVVETIPDVDVLRLEADVEKVLLAAHQGETVCGG